MRLNDEGVIPSVTPSEYMPSRPQLLEFMGQKHNSGYVFDSHGSPEYEDYVKELFVRVEQMNWPHNNVLPFHFSRGLLSEAMGTSVNWAEFAFKRTRPHQSRTRIPRVREDFAELQTPLHPLIKVLPPNFAADVSVLRIFNPNQCVSFYCQYVLFPVLRVHSTLMIIVALV